MTILLGAAGTERSPWWASTALPDRVDGPQGGVGLGGAAEGNEAMATERRGALGLSGPAEDLTVSSWAQKSDDGPRQLGTQWNQGGVTLSIRSCCYSDGRAQATPRCPKLRHLQGHPCLAACMCCSLGPVAVAAGLAGCVQRCFSRAGSQSSGSGLRARRGCQSCGWGCLPRDGLSFQDLSHALWGLLRPGLLVGVPPGSERPGLQHPLHVHGHPHRQAPGQPVLDRLPFFQDLVQAQTVPTSMDSGGLCPPGGRWLFREPGSGGILLSQEGSLQASKATPVDILLTT